jgi:hypothetical protein
LSLCLSLLQDWYAAIPLTTSPSTCTKTIYVVLTKHWGTPWWWFLREPKYVGVFIVTLIVTLILFRVHVRSDVHLLDFNKRTLLCVTCRRVHFKYSYLRYFQGTLSQI